MLDHAMGSHEATHDVDKVLGQVSGRGIGIPRPSDVRAYLRRHPDMVAIVETASAGALERVQEGTQLSLEVYRDPEIEDEHLALYLRQDEYDESILETLDEIRSACEGRLSGESGRLAITTDFRPPG